MLNESISSEDETQMLDAIDRWLERDVRDNVMALERVDEYPHEMVDQMRELGLFGATIPTEYGGLGLPAGTYAKIVTRISEVWMSLTGIFNSHLIMSKAVERFGTEAQKDRFLPLFASGEIRGGLALTEPNCGTDLQAIRTTAVRQGDNFTINGTKTWISNGIEGRCFAVLVKTDTEVQPRHRGMSLFLAEKGNGLWVGRKHRQARLQGHRLRRTGVRELPGVGGQPDRRRGRAGLLPDRRRIGTRPYQCRPPGAWGSPTPRSRRPRRIRRYARRWASRSANTRPSRPSLPTWRRAARRPGC